MVPYGAGGATDVLARIFAERLQQSLGQPFTIENRGGGGGQIGAAAFARAPADGYTLFFTSTAPITIVQIMNGKEPRTDFVPVAIVAVQPVWLVANSESPFKTFDDVVQNAKANPGKLTFGSPGLGTESQLAAEAAIGSAGIKLLHVPFRAGTEVVAALLGRQIDLASLTTASVAGALKQGTMKAFGVSSPQRIPDFSDVPTFAELGHGSATMLPWWGLMAPAGTPPSIVHRLAQELEAATKDLALRDRLKASFVQIDFAGPQEFAQRLEAEVALYSRIIGNANLKVDR
jgi:tripartite-type tricarboxylate transporter receptor subunit TctC